MKTITIGIFPNVSRAEKAITDLKEKGVSDSEISYVYKNEEGEIESSQEGVGKSTAKGATAGAALGAIAGLVVANGILPGLGSLFVAGPLATALGLTGAAATTVAGATTGAVAGGLIAGLASLGVDKDDANIYQDHVNRGEILVVSRSETPGVSSVFSENNAMEIREYVEA